MGCRSGADPWAVTESINAKEATMGEYTFLALLDGVAMPGDKAKPCKLALLSAHRKEIARLAIEGAGFPKEGMGIGLEVTIRTLQDELPGADDMEAAAKNFPRLAEENEVTVRLSHNGKTVDGQTGEVLDEPA